MHLGEGEHVIFNGGGLVTSVVTDVGDIANNKLAPDALSGFFGDQIHVQIVFQGGGEFGTFGWASGVIEQSLEGNDLSWLTALCEPVRVNHVVGAMIVSFGLGGRSVALQ